MLRVGTDCSGIEAPIQALFNLGIPFSHEFSCEIDPYCVQTIEANFSPKIIFTDITKRRIKDVPDIDLYVCGFPCQPFSSAGKRLGVFDIRGTLFYSCYKVIKNKKPSYFLLENVEGLMTIHNGEFFLSILELLNELKIYYITWKVLNTKDYGIPQSRKRLFIVGSKNPFKWPSPKKCPALVNFIDKKDRTPQQAPPSIVKSGFFQKLPIGSLFVDIGFKNHTFPNSDRICPCIMTESKLWCVPFHRRANIKEHLSLQGFPKTFKQVVSNTQMKKQLGNSISVCVLEHIFQELFYPTLSQ